MAKRNVEVWVRRKVEEGVFPLPSPPERRHFLKQEEGRCNEGEKTILKRIR